MPARSDRLRFALRRIPVRVRANGSIHPRRTGHRQARIQARKALQATRRMNYAVEFTQSAENDRGRLCSFGLDRAETLEQLNVTDEAIKVIRQAALSHLPTTPLQLLQGRCPVDAARTHHPVRHHRPHPSLRHPLARVGARHRRTPPARGRFPLTRQTLSERAAGASPAALRAPAAKCLAPSIW